MAAMINKIDKVRELVHNNQGANHAYTINEIIIYLGIKRKLTYLGGRLGGRLL